LTKSFLSVKIHLRMTTKGGFLMREKIILVCSECMSRNYTSTKNKQTQKERIEVQKYCTKCNKHTLHKESK
jgi:large subunit ribosomal protein L33